MWIKKMCAATTAMIILFSGIISNNVWANQQIKSPVIVETENSIESHTAEKNNVLTYKEYLQQHQNYKSDVEDIVITADSAAIQAESGIIKQHGKNHDAVLSMKDTDSINFSVSIPQDGLYAVTIEYMPLEGTAGTIEQQLFIDNAIPFKEGNYFTYKRSFVENYSEKRVDLSGNDLKPSTTEIFVWKNNPVSDPSGYVTEPFAYALSQGTHTITLKGQSSSVLIKKITLHRATEYLPYQTVLQKYQSDNLPLAELKDPIITEAEQISGKSDVTIYPISDRVSPQTVPQHPQYVKLNTIGGAKWKSSGQWISWEVDVPKSGLYYIAPRYRQSFVDGTYVSRKILINGKIQFQEAQALKFYYNSNWQLECLGGQEHPYAFYFKQGKNTITMEVTLGDAGERLGQVQSSLANLNAIYRSILMVTGSVPDTQRDYHFEKLIPAEIELMKQEHTRLKQVVESVVKESGRGNYVSLLNKIIFQLERMSANPRQIARNLEEYKANIGSLGTWLLTAREQPLELDRIYVVGADTILPKADAGFFRKVWFGIENFVCSFFNDYTSIGQSVMINSDKNISVWIQTGRDQATILRQLIDTQFSEKHNIKVNLQLVAPGTLLPSVLAKKGPDVSLNNVSGDPINYAIRNAVVDISKLEGFQDAVKSFNPQSLIPYTFQNKTYALPETLSFPMFFYRIDIFEELGLKPPKTWDELIAIIPTIQQRNMNMAFPVGLPGYALMLYQNNGSLYVGEGEKSNLTSDTALDVFQQYTELFTLYGLPESYDFPNRFRTGEMPCGIQDYSVYNHLVAFAPEIKGLWDFVPVPGIEDKNGNVNNVSVCGGTNAMIMSSSQDVNSSWKFVKWWTGAEAQSMFAVEMESALGPAAKQPTANMDALFRMPWNSREASNIKAQLEHIVAIPEVPGGYFTSRAIDFAFRKVYNNRENPVEVLDEYIDELNAELARKRKEFGLRS